MSKEAIWWYALTPAQRDSVVAKKVMQWEPVTCDGKIEDMPITPPSWSCQKCGWSGFRGDSTIHIQLPPRYSQSMDAAWLVLQEMAKRKQPKFQPFTLFVEAMLAASGWDNASAWSEIYPAYEIFMMAAVRWTPETICIAALKGCGYEVLTEESRRAALAEITHIAEDAGEYD